MGDIRHSFNFLLMLCMINSHVYLSMGVLQTEKESCLFSSLKSVKEDLILAVDFEVVFYYIWVVLRLFIDTDFPMIYLH